MKLRQQKAMQLNFIFVLFQFVPEKKNNPADLSLLLTYYQTLKCVKCPCIQGCSGARPVLLMSYRIC